MVFWSNQNVFVTGADGFIGSWLALRLLEKGANVTVVVRDLRKESNLRILNIEGRVNIISGDIADYQLILRILNEYEIESVFHLAAQPLVGVAEKSPLSTFESNIKGTWTVLEAARNSCVGRTVISSSDKAYGTQPRLPYTEDQPLLARNPYDVSKSCADMLGQAYFATYKLPIAITRNANTYGPADLNFSRIIPGTIRSALRGETPIIRSDGTPERDYLYVEDAVSAYLTLAENMHRTDVVGKAFNFGTGKPVSVLELFNTIVKLCGKNLEPKILGEAKNEIDQQYLSAERAKRLLGWEPRFSLEEGLKKTISWYKNYWRI